MGCVPGSVGYGSSADAHSQPRVSEVEKDGEAPRLDDAARGEVYVCFEGPI